MNRVLNKPAVAVLLSIAAFGFLFFRYRSVRPAMPDASSRPGAPSPAEVEKKREEFVREMELTPKQLEKLKEISEKVDPDRGPEALRDIMREFGPHLTPEQRKKAETLFKKEVQRQQDQASKVLPLDQYAKFQQKLEERLKEHKPPEEPPAPEDPQAAASGGDGSSGTGDEAAGVAAPLPEGAGPK